VLTADDDAPATAEMTEILNYVRMANSGFLWAQEGRPITLSLIEDLQGELMRGTPLESTSGRLRDTQVMIGRRPGAHNTTPVHASRFVPAPPGDPLRAGVRALVDWLHQDHAGDIDPIIAAGMAHYQFETLHPFRDGNGRLGRFLIVLTLLSSGVLSEPTLTVSPWLEERRAEYYDALLRVSTHGDWDTFLAFFSQGLAAAATSTRHQMLALAAAHQSLKETVRASSLRSAHALDLVDFAVANPSFTVRKVEAALMMGASGQQITWGVLVREALPILIQSATVTIITLLGYSAMAGAVGGGGVGDLAIQYGYQRNQVDVMVITVVVIVGIVGIIQLVGDMLSRLVNHR